MLIDDEGNVVYSAYKGVDLGTNVLDGPYDGTHLRTALRARPSSRTPSTSSRLRTSSATSRPTESRPGGRVSPIGDEGEIIGVLALQIPIANINAVMTGNEDWVDDGLGETGETYLVGQRRADALDVTPRDRGPGGVRGARRSTAVPRPRSPPGRPGSAARS